VPTQRVFIRLLCESGKLWRVVQHRRERTRRLSTGQGQSSAVLSDTLDGDERGSKRHAAW
jgi:hypothetical protein